MNLTNSDVSFESPMNGFGLFTVYKLLAKPRILLSIIMFIVIVAGSEFSVLRV